MNTEENEFLKLAVKLLFKRIAEGKMAFAADKVPKTIAALEAVKFDDYGNPLLETITGPVRALANMNFARESEALAKEAEERERNSPAHAYLGTPIPVDGEVLRDCAEKGTHSSVAFELYKETGTVLAVCAHSYTGAEAGEDVLSRDQAICAGLLVRITKFMVSVLQLASTADRGEVIMALSRSIYESAINLRFLLLRNNRETFDAFARAGLGPERELYDVINKNMRERGDTEPLPIEQRMLRSIARVARLTGINIEEVDPKRADWGGGLRQRLAALGDEELYLFLQRIPSHAVHGSWVDLVLHHLDEKDDGFRPRPEWSRSDARLFCPASLVVLRAAREYLLAFFGDLPELRPLYGRVSDLESRILKLDEAHEEWLSRDRKNQLPSAEA